MVYCNAEHAHPHYSSGYSQAISYSLVKCDQWLCHPGQCSAVDGTGHRIWWTSPSSNLSERLMLPLLLGVIGVILLVALISGL